MCLKNNFQQIIGRGSLDPLLPSLICPTIPPREGGRESMWGSTNNMREMVGKDPNPYFSC